MQLICFQIINVQNQTIQDLIAVGHPNQQKRIINFFFFFLDNQKYHFFMIVTYKLNTFVANIKEI